jgi:hypothetical protein
MTDYGFFHTGIVVAELEPAMARLTDLVGVTWAVPISNDTPIFDAGAGADVVVPMRMVYSQQFPHLELVEAVPGSEWTVATGSNAHHLGFWVDDLAAESGRLAASQCPLTVCGVAGGTKPAGFAYHEDPLGLRVELIDTAARPVLEAWWSGGPPPGG